MLDDVSVFAVHTQNTHQGEDGQKRVPIHVDHQRFVGTGGSEVIPDRFLGGNALGMFVESKSNGLNDR